MYDMRRFMFLPLLLFGVSLLAASSTPDAYASLTASPGFSLTDGSLFPELDGPAAITTIQIGASHYALVTAYHDDGVQIIDITDPSSPSPVAHITDGDAYPELDGAWGITAAQIGASHYALVASTNDHGVQIINITDPSSPSPAAHITDGDAYPKLDGARGITAAQIGANHYALVASTNDDGVQIIDITDPSSPSPAAHITDGDAYRVLNGAWGITAAQIGANHYALVASAYDHGVQIIDITDPSSPSPAAHVRDSTRYPELRGASGIATAQIGANHYALVASFDDDGVQLIDITSPLSPSPVANVTDGDAYPKLDGASGIATAQIGASHYALVTAYHDDGVQIINITDPSSPSPVANVTDGDAYPELDGAWGITAAQIGANHYALVTAYNDYGIQAITLAGTTTSNRDTTAPTFSSATLDESTGRVTVTFSEPIDQSPASSVNLARLFISETGRADQTALSGATYAGGADGSTITLTLTSAQLAAVRGYATPQLDISQGAVRDISGNDIASSADNSITVSNPVTVYEHQYFADAEQSAQPAWSAELSPAGSSGSARGCWSDHTASIFSCNHNLNPHTFTWGGEAYEVERLFLLSKKMLYMRLNSTIPAAHATLVVDGTSFDFDASKSSNPKWSNVGFNWHAADTVQLSLRISHVGGAAPTADAGGPQTVTEGATVSLNGTGSSDPDSDAITYSWAHTSGPSATLSGSNTATPSFTAPNVNDTTQVVFTLTVNDGRGGSDADTVTITVRDSPNSPPTADAGGPQTVAGLGTAYLAGTAGDADPEDTLTYAWTHNSTHSIPLQDSTALATAFTAPSVSEDTPVLFTLTVSDGQAQTTDTVLVTILANKAPTADAGGPQTVTEGATVSLNGTGSSDPDSDAITYSWAHTSGPSATLSGSNTATPSFTAPNVNDTTQVVFTLTVNDGRGGSDADTVTITVRDSPNSPPTADAGGPQTVAGSDTVHLAGTAGDADPEDTLTYIWTHNSTIHGAIYDPCNSGSCWRYFMPRLQDSDTLNPHFVASRVTEDTPILLTLTVSDGQAQTTDTVLVTILGNSPPDADAGGPQTVTEGDTVSLDGTGSSDPNGDTITYSWERTSGPSATLSGSNTATPSFTAPNVDQTTQVVFTLTVNDGRGGSDADTVTITVRDSPNSPPTADAGGPQTVGGSDTVHLAGTAGDADPEDTLAHTWTHNSTHSIPLQDSTALATAFTAPSVSEDTPVLFTLTVSDGQAQTTDTVLVTILGNSPPDADAGGPQTVTEGDTVSLDGTGSSDPNGDTITYSWERTSGPAATLARSGTATPTFTAPNVDQTTQVVFTLTVNDGRGGSDADTVTITVRDSANGQTVTGVGDPPEDENAPVITLFGRSHVTQFPLNLMWRDPGYTATDQEDGDITGSVVITGTVDTSRPGTYNLYYDVTDSSGNAAVRQVRTVDVEDSIAPVITLAGGTHTSIQINSAYVEPGYTATDNYDGDITGSVVVTGTVDTSSAGTYYLYYDVSDNYGNAAEQQLRTVQVMDDPDRQAGLPDIVKRYDTDGNGMIDSQEWGKATGDYQDLLISAEQLYTISKYRS